ALALAAGLCLATSPAGARPGQVESPSPSSTVAGDVPGLPPGMRMTGGIVREPGAPDRALNADQATAFMQAWFPDSIFSGKPPLEPSGEFEYATIDLTATYDGEPTEFEAFFTCKGEAAWVGMPAQQIVPGAFVPTERWVEGGFGARVIAAYKGLIAPIVGNSGTPPTAPPGADVSCPFTTDPQFTVAPLVPGETTTTSVPPTTTATGDDASGASSAGLWALVAAVVVGAGVIGTILGRRGRRTGRTEPTTGLGPNPPAPKR
ncbi:MAG: hypothetical protein ACKOOG_08505, partial [Actinomycetota bacterium]